MQDRTEQLVLRRLGDIQELSELLQTQAKGDDGSLYYENYWELASIYFDLGLIGLRKNRDWRKYLLNAIESAKQIKLIQESRKEDLGDLIFEYSDYWNILFYSGILAQKPSDVSQVILDEVLEWDLPSDDRLSFLIFGCLSGRDWLEKIPSVITELASQKHRALAVETYRTYFEMMGEIRDTGTVSDDLVLQAEANYERRARDRFYDDGRSWEGGGPNTPYMIDFILCAILKKANWQGKSTHALPNA